MATLNSDLRPVAAAELHALGLLATYLKPGQRFTLADDIGLADGKFIAGGVVVRWLPPVEGDELSEAVLVYTPLLRGSARQLNMELTLTGSLAEVVAGLQTLLVDDAAWQRLRRQAAGRPALVTAPVTLCYRTVGGKLLPPIELVRRKPSRFRRQQLRSASAQLGALLADGLIADDVCDWVSLSPPEIQDQRLLLQLGWRAYPASGAKAKICYDTLLLPFSQLPLLQPATTLSQYNGGDSSCDAEASPPPAPAAVLLPGRRINPKLTGLD